MPHRTEVALLTAPRDLPVVIDTPSDFLPVKRLSSGAERSRHRDDEELAAQVRKLAHRQLQGETLREALSQRMMNLEPATPPQRR